MIIKISVKPHTGKQEIIKLSDDTYKILVKSFPNEGKANRELIKFLQKHFKKYMAKNETHFFPDSLRHHGYKSVDYINIIKGMRSRNKIIEVEE